MYFNLSTHNLDPPAEADGFVKEWLIAEQALL